MLNIPGVTVFERGWLSANNILLTDNESATLIDSGYCAHQDQTLKLVQHALGSRSLDRLVNTHLHSDHCGGNAILQSSYQDLVTLIPPGESQAVARWDISALSYEPTGQDCPRFSFTDVLHSGQTLRMANLDWQVHAAPGHDPHSIVLFQPDHEVLISADALWSNGFGVVFPELEGISAFDEVAATLDLIESLKAKWVIPGHGAVFNDVASALSIARQKLEGFVKNPAKHAKYGAKVLLKYKLLELHRVDKNQFINWAMKARYFQLLNQMYSPEVSVRDWVIEMLLDLEKSKALTFQDEIIVNI